MEWTQEEGVQYNISVTPSVPITFIENTIVKLLLLYNMEYSLSLEAVGACENKESSNVQLFYGELIVAIQINWLLITINCLCFITAQCRNLQLAAANDSKPSLMYDDLCLTGGTTVDFVCPSGLVLNGTMSAICMENGEWVPDPQDVNCIEGLSTHLYGTYIKFL